MLIKSLVELRRHPKLDAGSRAVPDLARHDVCYILHKVFFILDTSGNKFRTALDKLL